MANTSFVIMFHRNDICRGICLFYMIRFTCMEQQCRSRLASKHMKIISTKHFILQIAVFGGENNVQQ